LAVRKAVAHAKAMGTAAAPVIITMVIPTITTRDLPHRFAIIISALVLMASRGTAARYTVSINSFSLLRIGQ